MLVHVVMKGYNLIDDRGMAHGAVRARPIGVHLTESRAIEQVRNYDFLADMKRHDCTGFKEGVQTSESRTCTLINDGRNDCNVKVWISSEELTL
jgi:hypothetical protein